MSESVRQTHGLEAFVGAAAPVDDPAVSVTVQTGTGVVDLRLPAAADTLRATAGAVIGQEFPVEPNTVTTSTGGDRRICWLGPDQWLLLTDTVAAAGRDAGALASALAGEHAAVNDVGGGTTVLRLSGSGVGELLAAGCTLDLEGGALAPGRCAQTGLARATVLLLSAGDAGDAGDVDVVVRRTFADYLCRWLAVAGRHAGGISFRTISLRTTGE